jgi:FecR protein
MNASLRWVAALVMIAGPFTSAPAAGQYYDPGPPDAATRWRPGDPEIVRLDYVEGDVRLRTSDSKNEKAARQSWVQAQAGIPIEAGFMLVTGTGRAEVDFQNGSVLFLADNSVLVFGELTDLNGPIDTEVILVTGTATIDVQPARSEVFRIQSRNLDAITVTYPDKAYLRFESFLDGTKVTPQQDTGATTNGNQKTQARAGQTMTYENGKLVDDGATTSHGSADWDRWVGGRIDARQSAIAAALKASGLSSPIPSLAYLDENGIFFACPPYGTCWQPTESQPQKAQNSGSSIEKTNFSSCSETRVISALDPGTKQGIEHYETTTQYWDWALCGSGRWVFQNDRYVLVLPDETRKVDWQRHPSVAWVRVGNTTGFVPKDPGDKNGRPPINLKFGLFVPSNGPDQPGERISVNASAKVTLLATAPEGFREFASHFPPSQPPKINAEVLRRTP